MTLKEDKAFENFVNQAQAMIGSDASREWLLEVWSGADGDMNRALNHALDTPPERMRKEGQKKKPSRPSKGGFDEDPFASVTNPPPMQTSPGVHSNHSSYTQPNYPANNGSFNQQGFQQWSPSSSLQMPQSFSLPANGSFATSPVSQSLQSQQLSQLFGLKTAVDNVIANPGMLSNALVMKNLRDSLLHALEVPEATLLIAERAKRSEEAAKGIASVQAKVASMLGDPRTTTTPALLQSLNDHMNQLRAMTAAHAMEQQQLATLANSASPGQLLLQYNGGRIGQLTQNTEESEDLSTGDEMDADWWERKKQKKQAKSRREVAEQTMLNQQPVPAIPLSSTNPFRDEEHQKSSTHLSRKTINQSEPNALSTAPPLLLPVQQQQQPQPIYYLQPPLTASLLPPSQPGSSYYLQPAYYSPQPPPPF